ncbi:plasmid mobilization relaxosome protein MobC [Tabrizicola sp. WMC-M-20]|nr:plasmid mobilization relaxosome protein MobC [Tabrizicola sp. WMC-M-20]
MNLIRALGDLGRIGNNVNQIARAANEGRIRSIDARSADVLDALRNKIEELRQEIREALG